MRSEQLFHSRGSRSGFLQLCHREISQSFLTASRVAFSLLRKTETLKIILFDSCQLLSYFILLVAHYVTNVPGDGIHQNDGICSFLRNWLSCFSHIRFRFLFRDFHMHMDLRNPFSSSYSETFYIQSLTTSCWILANFSYMKFNHFVFVSLPWKNLTHWLWRFRVYSKGTSTC